MKKPRSPHKWTWDYVDKGVRCWRMSDRATGELLGYVDQCTVGGALAWRAVVMVNGEPVAGACFNHWSKAKRGVLAARTGLAIHGALRGEAAA